MGSSAWVQLCFFPFRFPANNALIESEARGQIRAWRWTRALIPPIAALLPSSILKIQLSHR